MFKPFFSASLLASGLLLSIAPATAQTFSTLEERMSMAQFRAAGLDKLSPEELAELNSWLQKNVGGSSAALPATFDAPAADDRIGFRAETSKEGIQSRIIGEFRGWQGKTVFHLENGQVWQQTESDSWGGVKLENPGVTIKSGFMGSWVLRVDGYNTTTRVKRIK